MSVLIFKKQDYLFLSTSQDGLLSCHHLRGTTRGCNDEFGGDTAGCMAWNKWGDILRILWRKGKHNCLKRRQDKWKLLERSIGFTKTVRCLAHLYFTSQVRRRQLLNNCDNTQKSYSVSFETSTNLYGDLDTNRNRRRNMRSKQDEINEEIATSFQWNYRKWTGAAPINVSKKLK